MPKTWQDTISITRRLKIKYIWIDVLCVTQDSHEDWSHEVGRIGHYYQKSFLTVSALDSSAANSGMLHGRDRGRFVHLEGNLFLRPATRGWQQVFKDAPLSKRAWALQERILSTRILHYGRDDLFWECLTLSTRESSTVQYTLSQQAIEWRDEDFKRSLVASVFDPLSTEEGHRKWYRIVAQYSELNLTRIRDKLPAISGLASRIKEIVDDSYVAGLWESDLHNGLLWSNEGNPGSTIIGGAPSWS